MMRPPPANDDTASDAALVERADALSLALLEAKSPMVAAALISELDTLITDLVGRGVMPTWAALTIAGRLQERMAAVAAANRPRLVVDRGAEDGAAPPVPRPAL